VPFVIRSEIEIDLNPLWNFRTEWNVDYPSFSLLIHGITAKLTSKNQTGIPPESGAPILGEIGDSGERWISIVSFCNDHTITYVYLTTYSTSFIFFCDSISNILSSSFFI